MLTLGRQVVFICIVDTEKETPGEKVIFLLCISNNYIYNFTTALLKVFISISDFMLFFRPVYLKLTERVSPKSRRCH